MSDAKFRIMHGWLLAKAEVGGETYLALRGINFRGEYKKTQYAKIRTIRWHGPSTKLFNGDVHWDLSPNVLIPSFQNAVSEWPALAKAKIIGYKHNLKNETSGPTQSWDVGIEAGEAITQVAFDFSELQKLPYVVLEPGKQLDYPRHPVIWVNAKDIIKLDLRTAKNFNLEFPFIVQGAHAFKMEVSKSGMPRNTVGTNLLLQDTVAEAFEHFFGNKIFTLSRTLNGRIYVQNHNSLRPSFKPAPYRRPPKSYLRPRRPTSAPLISHG